MTFKENIEKLNSDNVYPFHMPGHKRNMEKLDAFEIDITEIDGYDNLHSPEGMIMELENDIAKFYDAEKSYVLVNGSTCGILAAISAAAGYGDNILFARNSHKSAYAALGLRGLKADYIYPEYIEEIGINGVITWQSIEDKLKNQEHKYSAVYITSPTYEGVVSDIKSIARSCHENNVILIVDEAHGAHFGLSDFFPETAVRCGADIVIQSIHKTLAGMTQTAVLHIGKGSCVDVKKIEYYLRVYQTSSPSYVLMTSVDLCFRELKSKGNVLWKDYNKKLEIFTEKCKSFNYLQLFGQNVDKNKIFVFDSGKIVIYSKNNYMSGSEIYRILREKYNIQLEMSMERYCLAMTSYKDTQAGFDRLYEALRDIDGAIGEKVIKADKTDLYGTVAKVINLSPGQQENTVLYTIAEAFEGKKVYKKLEPGDIAGEYIYVYPPGIPFMVPGELVNEKVMRDIEKYYQMGYEIHGAVVQGGEIYSEVIE